MRIVVIGAGGIGGWLGARLASTGQQVGFLVHGGTLEALRSEGLTLLDGSGGEPGTVTARIDEPLVSQDPGTLVDALGGHPDLVFVTTKVDALPGLAPALRRLIGPGTGVVSTQNGISAPGMLAGAVGVLEAAGIRAWVPDSIWAELWRKVSFVAVQGALGAAANAPIGVLRSELRDVFTAAVGEVVEVAAALGHDLATDAAADPVTAVLALADAQPAGATTSMQRDIAAGLPSELDAQVGSVCRAGDDTGVATPVLDLAHAVLAPREARARGRQ